MRKLARSSGLIAGVAVFSLTAWFGATRHFAAGAREHDSAQAPAARRARRNLSTSKSLLLPEPGEPQPTNSLPLTAALSPDGRYLALLNNGFGTAESGDQQSIAILDLNSGALTDFPDARLGRRAHQSYFLGLAFSGDGQEIYASMASLTDIEGARPGDTGNGIAVYKFDGTHVAPERFIRIPPQDMKPGQTTKLAPGLPAGKAVPYPAGLAVLKRNGQEDLLVADNLSDDALLMNAATGDIQARFDLSRGDVVPASYPYEVVVTRDGRHAFVSLWNASEVDELALDSGKVAHEITMLPPNAPAAPGSHPTALLLSKDESRLYVALANADRVAVVDTASGEVKAWLSTELPGEKYGGTFPNALALDAAGDKLYVADASANAVAVFDLSHLSSSEVNAPARALGFIPTEWYPTALAVSGDHLLVAAGKGEGTGPNGKLSPPPRGRTRPDFPYIATLIHGSVASINLSKAEGELPELTREVVANNGMRARARSMRFAGGRNPIHHVIYIIKENRSYDQVFGDIKEANGDPQLVIYGEDITPNQHRLARQFGVLDNFYVSGEVSGNGHVWSTAAISSDYTEKTWEIAYRSNDRTYDYEGEVASGFPLTQGIPDVDAPGTGYLWGDIARTGLSYRHYGEFVATEWCNDNAVQQSPTGGTPPAPGKACPKTFIHRGEALPANLGQPHGSPSPWPWPVPIIARDVPTKPELVGHFDPQAADFNLSYPDQFRVDEFLNEFRGFVAARQQGRKPGEMPQFVLLRLPNNHTAGTRPGMPKPEASIADNDLAVGRLVEAVSHSPYWDDTAIFILEDDAQDGPDHVDAHRSPALVISKYSPKIASGPFVDHEFYTTVNMIRTMELLLGLPPMNNNDAWAAPMVELFSGPGAQAPFAADYSNQKNRLLYQVNPPNGPGARESARMDFSHADAANNVALNRILWRERKGNIRMPAPKHTVFPAGDSDGDGD
ncbi:MAG TPA: beta-propeller fold lactonase family protein [Terriglobia bacterium]|nr:beta-propeller fold lactonase family protein [Terriglobia bacterium]